MKKILLLILGISFFSSDISAQSNWEEIYSKDNIVIEMKTEDCNPNNRLVPNTYAVLRYSNISNTDINFDFGINLWYNGIKVDHSLSDNESNEIMKSIIIEANSNITGNCTSKEDYLKVFYKHNHPEITNELTDIQIISKK